MIRVVVWAVVTIVALSAAALTALVVLDPSPPVRRVQIDVPVVR